MIFKNLLFGLGGTAVIGGVGYGIYASSQANDEDKTTTTGDSDSKNESSSSGSGMDSNDVSKTKEDKGKSTDIPEKNSEGSSVTGSSEKTGETPGETGK